MIIRKLLPIIIGLLTISFCPIPVFAAQGSIQVKLPEELEGTSLHYAKVAEWDEAETFQIEKVAGEKETMEYDGSVKASKDGMAKIENLEEGIYQIAISGTEEYEFSPVIVSIPMWNEEEQFMLYEVEVIPKYTHNILTTETEDMTSPETGDESEGSFYLIFGMISFIIVMIISCHNRFKCGRMSRK